MKPSKEKTIYRFCDYDVNRNIWIDVHVSELDFELKTKFDATKRIDKYSFEEYTHYMNLNRIAFDFGVQQCANNLTK